MRNIDKSSWRFLNSLWLILVFIFILNWTAFIFIGARVKQKKWVYIGLGYFALTALFMISVSSNWNSGEFWTGTYLISWLVCIIHVFLIRNEFLQKLYEMDEALKQAYINRMAAHQAAGSRIKSPEASDYAAIAIAAGLKKVTDIDSLTASIKHSPVKEKLKVIIELASKILDQLKETPEEIQKANKFLNYYLDATQNIIRKYIKLNEQDLGGEEVADTMRRFEELLGTIEKAFQKQLQRLMEDDLFDLEAEMSVLDRTIKSEELI